MYLLYLDDAGSVKSKNERHFVLSGICIFERQVHYLSSKLDKLAESISPNDSNALEFHGSQMLPGRGFWRSIRDRSERRKFICRALEEAKSLRGNWALFGVVVDKSSISPNDPIEYAFEQLCSRFDKFLKRRYHYNDNQRGMMILDKSTRETSIQKLALHFKTVGHQWGVTHNIADVPFFVDSSATRLIQYADLVSYALWRKFEKNDPEFFNVIDDWFDTEGGVVHGLLHQKRRGDSCDCPYCATRAG